ncbi:hypothetical protein U3516DRAFT_749401 [Neocallimastix sp. 'constans']
MEKNLIIEYNSHNHPEKKYDVSLSTIKHKIKDGIEKVQFLMVTTFTEIPNESKYYKTKEYNGDIFVDGTFFIALKFSYQIFITRTYANELDSFYTTSFAILQNKEQETYKIFKKLKKNANTSIPSYYKLIDKLNELEHLPYYDYQRKIRGI